MKPMICLNGEPSDLEFLPEIADLGVGIDLGSLGLVGICSERNWAERCAMHRGVRERFDGPLALHGPIDFEPFYEALERHAPEATISLELSDKIDVKMADIRKPVARFG